MKYALNDKRQSIEPFSKGRAACPVCGSAVIAKCGAHRIHHWAHQGLEKCDSWKEKETQWHRDWKNKFPAHWQEYVQKDDAGERHIADIRTDQGLVIEFQHSHLDPNEREARELFHKKIIWVVDGTRLKKDYGRFQKSVNKFKHTKGQGLYLVPNPSDTFPALWLNCKAPVFFDFLGTGTNSSLDKLREPLWQLLPGRREDGHAVVVAMSREYFVAEVSRPPLPAPEPRALPQQPLSGTAINIAALRQIDPQLFRVIMRPQRRPTSRRF